MQPDEFLQKNYRYFQEWQHWYDKAVRLRRAGLQIYRAALPHLRKFEKARRAALKELETKEVVPIRCEEPDVFPVFALYGAALENIFKALMISKDDTLIGSHKLSSKLKSHKLIELATNAGMSLVAEEKELLHWTTEVVIWKGRYPVPTDTKTAQFFHSFDQATLESTDRCIGALNDIFARTKKLLPPRCRLTRYPAMVRLD
jgi:hypothetical protein